MFTFKHEWQRQQIHVNSQSNQGEMSPSFLKRFPEKSRERGPIASLLSLPSFPYSLWGKITSSQETHYILQSNGCEPCSASIMSPPVLSIPLTMPASYLMTGGPPKTLHKHVFNFILHDITRTRPDKNFSQKPTCLRGHLEGSPSK